MTTDRPAEHARITGRDLTIPYAALCRIAGFTLTAEHLSRVAEAVTDRTAPVLEAISAYTTTLPTVAQYRAMLAGEAPFTAPPATPETARAAEIRRALVYLDSYRDSEVVDDLEQVRAILAQLAAIETAYPVPTLPDTDSPVVEVCRFACRTCDFVSPTFSPHDECDYEGDHAAETGHQQFHLYTVARTSAGVLLMGRG
ncbi:hypothetical protein [Nocardia salmonicida]|uniref:hypothetical protein n=1 Tax=Nocardia salmonicida TaxID=53431 RepID=UPI0033F04C98